jgi:hypothetical protein
MASFINYICFNASTNNSSNMYENFEERRGKGQFNFGVKLRGNS